jgi:FkbM family methyltransferase
MNIQYEKSNTESAARSRLYRRIVPLLLRPGRVTKYFHTWKGYNTLLRLYRKHIPEDLLTRITDFDDDLIVDVNVRGIMGMCLWHFPSLFEKNEREIFCASIFPGCTVLDVGANIGFYTLIAAKRGARVFAIEADPINAAMLRHHVTINGFNNRVTIFEMAATDSHRQVTLYRHPFNLGESNIVAKGAPALEVQGMTLDSLQLPSIDICKMDIEGAELSALHGMKETLARSPEIKLLVEYASHYGNADELLRFLRSSFSTVKVIENMETNSLDQIPPFCNLLATK